MPTHRDLVLDMHELLDGVERVAPVEAVDVIEAELIDKLGVSDVSFLIADFSGDAVIRFGPTRYRGRTDTGRDLIDPLETMGLADSPYASALHTQQVVVVEEGEGVRIYAPVTDRGDALGILEMALGAAPSDKALEFIAAAAHAFAYVVTCELLSTLE